MAGHSVKLDEVVRISEEFEGGYSEGVAAPDAILEILSTLNLPAGARSLASRL